jgi:predicted transcriptional regulator
MKIEEIRYLLNAKISSLPKSRDCEYNYAFASDLMSDVLRIRPDEVILITGLCNLQTIRTAEMSDINCVVLGRGKQPNDEMKRLAQDNNITLMYCDYSVYKICSILSKEGIKPLY